MLNDFAMNQIFPVFMAAIIWLQVMSLYACIVYHGIIPYPTFAIFPLLVADATLVNTLLYTLDSLILERSAEILAMEKREVRSAGKGKDMKLAVRKVWAKQ